MGCSLQGYGLVSSVTLALSAGERLASVRRDGFQKQKICSNKKGKSLSVSEVSETAGFFRLQLMRWVDLRLAEWHG